MLMALVAGVALAIPWWRWHVEMLKRSDDYRKKAIRAAAVLRMLGRALPQEMQSAANLQKELASLRRAGGSTPSPQLLRVQEDVAAAIVSSRERVAYIERAITRYERRAAACRRAVTLPWLDVEPPED